MEADWVQIQVLAYIFVSAATGIAIGGILWARSNASTKRHDESIKRHEDAELSRKDLYNKIEKSDAERLQMISDLRTEQNNQHSGLRTTLYKEFTSKEAVRELKNDILGAINELKTSQSDFVKRIEEKLDKTTFLNGTK